MTPTLENVLSRRSSTIAEKITDAQSLLLGIVAERGKLVECARMFASLIFRFELLSTAMNITVPFAQLRAVCERHNVRKLALFGSVLRDDFRPDSDVDVLVEYEQGTRITLFDMVDLQLDLEALWGHKVDLGMPSTLSKYIRQTVLRSAQVIYERP